MKRKYNKKEKIALGVVIGLFAILVALIVAVKVTGGTVENKPQVEVSQSEIQKYKNMIGNNMDVKKSILILFDTYDECKNFIIEHGEKDNPHEQGGGGAVAYMSDGYYNIVGKSKLEEAFDSMSDGEYTKEPIQYSGMYCYLKRLGVDSIIENEEELKKLIIQDKEQAIKNK